MIRLLLFSLLFCIGVRAQTTPFRVNGVIKNNPNLATSATALVSASGSTISISPTNLANAQIAAGAAIAASKLDTTLMTEAEVAALYQPLDPDLTSAAAGITGLVKGLGNGSGYSAATSGTDYFAKSGSSAAGDVAVFDGTDQTLRRSTSAARLGDDSAASYVLTLANSGTDVTLTASSGALALDSSLAITGGLTLGNSSGATYVISSALSGATDPTITFANASITASNPFGISSGSQALPGLAFSGNPDTGIYELSGAVAIGKDNSPIAFFGATQVNFYPNHIALGVATATDTFIGRDSASVAKVTSNGTALAGFKAGTLTLANPTANSTTLALSGGSNTGSDATTQIDLSGTWNSSGSPTFIRGYVTNTAIGATAKLLDLGVNTSSSMFSVDKSGSVTLAGSISASSGSATIAGSGSLVFSGRAILTAEAAAIFQFSTDTASPAAYKLKNADGSGTDSAGGTLTIAGGQSTGTGRGGDFVVQTSPSGSTGSSANAYSNRKYISAKAVTLTDTVATAFANIAVASSTFAGATLTCTVTARDASDFQSLTSIVRVDAVNKAGTVTATVTQTDNTTAASAGTLSVAYTVAASGNTFNILANADTSLTPTAMSITWAITALNADGVATVVPQ